VNIVLELAVSDLSDVVVVGYGTQKKVNLTGAVSTITAKDLSVVPTANVGTLLYGKLPGLIPLQRSGEPGSDGVELSIRGLSSPLLVVDGIQGRDFSRLDPNEIESITILKDAASAAVYGVSSGNGVILVTTKKGLLGKPKFNYQMNYGVQHWTNYFNTANSEQYATLINESAVNLGGVPEYTPEEIQKFRDGTDPNYPNFDYYKYFIRDYAPQFSQSMSVRGGSEKIKYFFLLGQSSQASMWNGSNQNYKKYNFRSNVDAHITDNLDISVNISGRVEDNNHLTQSAYLMGAWLEYQRPIYNPKTPDGKIAATNYALAAYLDQDLTGYIRSQRNVIEGILSVNYKIPFIKGLSANVKAARDIYFGNDKTWIKQYKTYRWDEATQTSVQVGTSGVNSLTMATSRTANIRFESSLNYSRTFGEGHHVKGLLLFEESQNQGVNFQASRTGYQVPIDQLFAGPDLNKSNSGSAFDDGRKSYVGRVNYDYLGKYLFEYSFRYDGSPRFPPDKRWGYFSGVSAGWRISEENFIKNNPGAIDDLKLRGSWGKLGNDKTGNFQYLAGYNYPSNTYILGGNVVTNGLIDAGTPNPNITWETSQMFDLGVDMSLWKGLLSFEADIFYRKRDGILAKRTTQLPPTFGATLPAENLNSDDARGYEIVLGHTSKIGEVKYLITANLSYTRLKNRHVEQRDFNSQYDNWRNNNANRWANLFWGYKAIGQFQSMEDIYSSPVQDGRANSTLLPGDIKYEDFNKDGVINDMDQQIIGKGANVVDWTYFESTPELNYGFNINASWKGFAVAMNWSGASNYNMQLQYNMMAPFRDVRSASTFFMDRWHREDPLDPDSDWIPGKFPATRVNGTANNMMNSSFWLLDVRYLRLKSLGISYTLERALLKRFGVEGLTVSLSGQNLLTISNIPSYLDPENRSTMATYYPQQKTYNLGISVTF
jgi:TonB-linked SusC/RagA family outer membrane protein